MSAAAGQGGPARITLGQAKVLLTAAQWAGMSARDLAELVVGVAGAETMEEITPEGWAQVMDHFLAGGFRHPAVPMVTAAQLAALDAARREAGLDGRTFVRGLREMMGLRSRRQLDGAGFACAMEWLARLGSRVALPGHGTMTRPMGALVLHGARHLGMRGLELQGDLLSVGGVFHVRDLDPRAFMRLVIAFDRAGVPAPVPAPRVEAAPGMVTQAQANLIWRLWLDFGGWHGDASAAALDAAIGSMLGLGGGLATLARAGAAEVIDRFMVPRLNGRREPERAGGRPDGRPPGGQVHDGKQRARRPRGREERGRR